MRILCGETDDQLVSGYRSMALLSSRLCPEPNRRAVRQGGQEDSCIHNPGLLFPFCSSVSLALRRGVVRSWNERKVFRTHPKLRLISKTLTSHAMVRHASLENTTLTTVDHHHALQWANMLSYVAFTTYGPNPHTYPTRTLYTLSVAARPPLISPVKPNLVY